MIQDEIKPVETVKQGRRLMSRPFSEREQLRNALITFIESGSANGNEGMRRKCLRFVNDYFKPEQNKALHFAEEIAQWKALNAKLYKIAAIAKVEER